MAELSFANRVVVITGAGRGLGREYALAFARRGAAVVVNDLGTNLLGDAAPSSQPADEVVAEIRQAGGKAVAHHASIASPEGAKDLVDTAIRTFGRLDAVVNNAGVLNMKPFAEVTLEGLQRHLAVHVIGSFLVCKAAWPHMVAQKYGRIVNTISGGIFGLPGLAEYGPAKGGVFAFTRSLALEAIEHGIRVNAVAPQAATRMLHASALAPDLRERLDRIMKPELASPGVLYLAHEDCAVNGETLAVSGGKVCRIALTYNDGFTDPSLTPEMIRDRIGEVLDPSSAAVWTSATARYEERAKDA
ncbi:SDR family NAD(P)-dependent oxidoreductase [Ramlibacter sp.]|uniref:SDR family NAD(P)-dependent oxidoreductase n=1 Tax=Ramlibacter sp. TaxID=1917967 RepID=UPI003D1001D7